MHQQLEVKEKNVTTAQFQFIFPFSFKAGKEEIIFPFLQEHQYKHFELDHTGDEDKYYGDFRVSHGDMKAYYLPFTKKILFPSSEHEKGVQRYSKALNIQAVLTTDILQIPFKVHSIDLTLCPYELGFLTIRTEVFETAERSLTLSQGTEFAARFRVLNPRSEQDLNTQIYYDGNRKNIRNFVFDFLFDDLKPFLEKKNQKESNHEPLSFFEEERMYVHSFISINEMMDIDLIDVYRSICLSGLNEDGTPYVSANNQPYIEDYLKKHSFFRWAPKTYYTMEEHSFLCITNEKHNTVKQLGSKMYGEFYYALLLNLFHKIVLLKIAHEFAELKIQGNAKSMAKLIYSINSFTANYFFTEIASQSQGRDIYNHLRETFNIELLYKDAKQTLYSLFKYQENANSKKDSLFLLFLTLYSVIGQMFGMSFVIGDFAGKIKWGQIMDYNPIEYFALFVAISGVCVSIFLGVQNVYQWYIEMKNRLKWVKETVLSSAKKHDGP